jgi:hypothetical protein
VSALKDLMGYLLPVGTLEYFDLIQVIKDKEGLVLFLEEKNVFRIFLSGNIK